MANDMAVMPSVSNTNEGVRSRMRQSLQVIRRRVETASAPPTGASRISMERTARIKPGMTTI